MRSAKAVILTLLSIAFFAPLCHAQEKSGWQALGLEEATIEGATVYCESSLRGDLPTLEAIYKELTAWEAENDENLERVLEKWDAIVREVEAITGGTATKLFEAKHTDIFKRFMDHVGPRLTSPNLRVTLYLILGSTVKNYLRSGGSLPDFSYDAAADLASYNFTWRSGQKQFHYAILVRDPDSAEEDIRQAFRMLSTVGRIPRAAGVAVHELTELAILLRLRPRDPYFRWFSDGFANAIAIRLLAGYASDAEARRFANIYAVSIYSDLETEVDLEHWLGAHACIETPLKRDKRLTLARYAYATSEAQRLIEREGIGCLAAILDEVQKTEERGSRELLRAIKDVTGEDMARRFARYRTFDTEVEGLKVYGESFSKARGERDYALGLYYLLRVRELRPQLPMDYAAAAFFLWQMDKDEAADRVIARHLALLQKTGKSEKRLELMKLAVNRGLAAGKPERVSQIAEEVLQSEADNVDALAVRMLRLHGAGNPAHARKIARRILQLDPTDNSIPRQLAQQISDQP